MLTIGSRRELVSCRPEESQLKIQWLGLNWHLLERSSPSQPSRLGGDSSLPLHGSRPCHLGPSTKTWSSCLSNTVATGFSLLTLILSYLKLQLFGSFPSRGAGNLRKAVLQLLFTSATNMKEQTLHTSFLSQWRRGAKLGSSLSADSLKLLITGNVIPKSVLTIMYWDLKSVMQSLTLKKVFVDSPSWLSWAFRLCFWGRNKTEACFDL